MQTQLDSFLEAASNTAVGFIVSWLTWIVVVAPLYGLAVGAASSLGITAIFTVSSLLRSYVLRRAFDGRSVYSVLRGRRG
jgi:hypothetical protein